MVSWKEKVENNLGLVIATIAITSSTSGWYAHGYFLKESQQVVLEQSEVSRLKLYAKLGKEDLVELNESLEKKVFQLETKLATTPLSKDISSEKNVSIQNVTFKPSIGSKLKVGETIEITFDYEFKNNAKGNIWAFSSDLPVTYSSSKVYSSNGTVSRNFTATKSGWTKTVDILIKSTDGSMLKKHSIPARYEFVDG